MNILSLCGRGGGMGAGVAAAGEGPHATLSVIKRLSLQSIDAVMKTHSGNQ